MSTCGIILAGGSGSRLLPITRSVNKQLLPIYDKPLVYYPLSLVVKTGIKDILVIVNSDLSRKLFENLLGDGSKFGVTLSYLVQSEPRGIADAFLVGEKFINGRSVMMVLGDNIFHGQELDQYLQGCLGGNFIFGTRVADPTAYGVAMFEEDGYTLADIVEKPTKPPSQWAVPGLYFYNSSVVEETKKLNPSKRGELEITDLSKLYLRRNDLKIIKLYDTDWFDCGTHDSLLNAAQYVRAVQDRTGEKVGNPLIAQEK